MEFPKGHGGGKGPRKPDDIGRAQWLASSSSKAPELELPRRFRRREIEHWISRIPSKRGRALTKKRIDGLGWPPAASEVVVVQRRVQWSR